MILRDYQERLVKGIFDAWAGPHRCVLAVAPTGSGKGDCIVAVVRRLVPARILFVVHLDELVADISNRLRMAGLGEHVRVTTWQTLAARNEFIPDLHYIIADEAHRSVASTYRAFLDRHKRARVVGFTATAQRGDGAGLGDAGFTAIVQGPQIRELVAAGHLAQMRVVAPDDETDSLAWDPLDAWRLFAEGQKGIVFCDSVEDSARYFCDFERAGIQANHVDGTTKNRRELLQRFDRASTGALFCYRLFLEGVNVPTAKVCMLATRISHPGAMLQAIGRVRRPTGLATLIDLRGNVHRPEMGWPDDDRIYSLETGVHLANQEALPTCRQCPSCLSWVGGASCLFCGGSMARAKKPARVVRYELKVRDEEADRKRLAKQAALARSGPLWDLFVRLVREARRAGKPMTAATYKFKMATGKFPKWKAKYVDEVSK